MDWVAGLKQTIARLGFAKIIAMAVVAVTLVTALIAVSSFSVEPKRLLYSDLDPAESAKIGQKLDEMKVPFEVRGDGATILVPASQVARLRMELAGAGLPHQGAAGYDLLDQQSPMNMTSFMQRIQRLRALEGELARSIVTLGGVKTARVHIVLPERETFARETPKPTASVVVQMASAGRLGLPQAAAIRLLVSGAVPSMAPESVSVLDPSGVVIGADDTEGAQSGRLNEMKNARERKLQATVTELLEPLIGRNKVRVAVAVDLDNSREVAREEKFDPNSQVERSKQTQSDQDTTTEHKGQDPVSVAQNIPNQAATPPNPDSARSSSTNTRNGQTVNYEISSVRSERVREAGDLKRMTIAVVVDGIVDEKGQYQQRPREELARLSELIQSAVGFDVSRGDRVTVDTMRFAPDAAAGTAAEADANTAAQLPILWIAVGGGVLLILAAGAFMMMRKRNAGETAPALPALAEAPALAVVSDDAAGQSAAALTGPPPPSLGQLAGPSAAEAASQLEAQLGGTPLEQLTLRPALLAALLDLVDTRPEEALATLRSWLASTP